jgi:aspartate aminotransferase
VYAQTTPDFDLDVDNVLAALTDRTRVVLICSPNNPTGRVYAPERVAALGAALERRAAEHPDRKPVYLVNDAVYGRLVYDEDRRRSVLFSSYRHSIVAGSFSKDMSLAGERIGYLALNPADPYAAELHGGLATVNRILGFVNAPAVVQRAIAQAADATVELSFYEVKVNALLKVLADAGIECVRPEGAFFLFPRVPGGLDDLEFVRALQSRGVLVVPGRGFGTEGHFRLSCGVSMDVITRSAPLFKEVADKFRADHGL